MMKAFLNVWLQTMKPVRDPVMLENTASESVEKNEKFQAEKEKRMRRESQECEKILQLILSLQMPAHTVLNAVNLMIEENSWS